MEPDKLVSYLANNEVTELELKRIYSSFEESARQEGFSEGCAYVRDIISKARMASNANLKKRFSEFLTKLEDYLNATPPRSTL